MASQTNKQKDSTIYEVNWPKAEETLKSKDNIKKTELLSQFNLYVNMLLMPHENGPIRSAIQFIDHSATLNNLKNKVDHAAVSSLRH